MDFLKKLTLLIWHKILVNLILISMLVILFGEITFPNIQVHENIIQLTHGELSLQIVKLIFVFAFYLLLVLFLKKRISTLFIVCNAVAFTFYTVVTFFVFTLFQFSLFTGGDSRIIFYDSVLIILYISSIALMMFAKTRNFTFSQKFLRQNDSTKQ